MTTFSKPTFPEQWNAGAGGRYITSDELASLPTDPKDVQMGTWVYCVDTQTCYMFNAKTREWVEQ